MTTKIGSHTFEFRHVDKIRILLCHDPMLTLRF